MDRSESINELIFGYARGIWKHRWVGVWIAWVVLIAGILVVDQLQNRYRAEAKVYIDSSSVLKPLLRGLAVETNFDAIVQVVVRELLSRPNLERAVRLLDLDLEVDSPEDMEALMASISSRVNVEIPKRSNIFEISYTDTNRIHAQKMVQVLLDIFVEDTLGKSDSDSDSAIEFLDVQIEKYDNLLSEAEQRREAFKRKNIGLMPEDGAGYFSQLQQGKLLLEQAELSLAESENRREQIEVQIAELKANELGQGAATKSSLDLRIEEQEQSIDELLLLYTEEHPDVINALQVLESLRKRKDQESVNSENSLQNSVGENPVLQEMQILLASTKADISSYFIRVATLQKKQTELKKLIDIVPKIESDLQRLNRDYEVHKKNYNELVLRREQAKISEDVESKAEQVKFRIVEPPYASLRPYFPNRPLFDAAILLVALGVGYGISLLISFFRPVFYNQNDIRSAMTTPILGSIQKFDTPDVLFKRRKNLALFTLANILLVCAAGLLTYLHNEDVILIDRIQNLVY